MESFKYEKRQLCTICYNTVNHSSNDTTTNSSCQFITLISRHLLKQSKCSSLKLSSIPEAYKSLTKSDNPFNYVQFCKDCEVTTDKFCSLYQKITELELGLDFEISKLLGTLQNADKIPVKVKQFEKHSSELTTNDESKLVEFRKTLKQNIQTYENNVHTKSAPRIYLSPVILDNSPSKLEHMQDFIPRAFSPINLEEPSTIYDEVERNSKPAHQDEQNDVDNDIPNPNVNPIWSSTRTSIKKRRYKCTSCQQSFRDKFALEKHNINKHIEKYFSSVTLSSLKNDQFKACIHRLIDQTIDNFTSVESKYKCTYCYVPKLFVERRSLKVHLILHHRSVINEKLTDLQKNKTKIHDFILNKSTVNSRHVCSVCSQKLRDDFAVKKHESTSHPEIFIKSSKRADEDDETFKTYVGYVVEQQIDQQFVKLKLGPNLMRNKYRCKSCSKILIQRTEAKSHIILKHDIIIVEKLNEIRNGSKTFNEIKLEFARFKHRGTPKYYPPVVTRNIRDGTVGQHTECTICNTKTGSSYHLSRHEALYHPEHFFVSVKSEHVRTPQFALLVSHLFSQEFGKFDKTKDSVSSEMKYRCNHCPNTIKTLRDVKVHVLLVHFDKLAEKLKELQNDLAGKDSS